MSILINKYIYILYYFKFSLYTFVNIVLVVFMILFFVSYLMFLERKLIGWMHSRIGPNRVGPLGLLQPIADVIKLVFKEIIQPIKANYWLYIISPIIVIMSAFSVWAVIPFCDKFYITNLNIGLLYVMSISSVGIYGIILAGWSSNSKYAFLGSIRAAAQIISYEVSMGFILIAIAIISNSLDLHDIVFSQMHGFFAKYGFNFLSWNWLPLFPMFIIYFISGVAETHRHPFDVVECESEIVAGHMIDYSGTRFALFFLAEYTNMILMSILTTILFLGGWDSPIRYLRCLHGTFWLFLKILFLLFIFIWIRASLPRYRYDQIMSLGWKVYLPICLFMIIFISIWVKSPFNIWH